MEKKTQPDDNKILKDSIDIYNNLLTCSDKNSIKSFSQRLDHLHQISSLSAKIKNSELEKYANMQIIIEKQNLEKIHGPVILPEITAIVSGQNNMIHQTKKILEN